MLVGGMVAIGTKKMSAKNAQAIEEHTGIPPEELEDADLAEAMTEREFLMKKSLATT